MTRTVTLQEQMQIIMEKMPEPAVIEGAFYEVYDTPQEVLAFADYGDTVREHGGENPVEGDELVAPICGCFFCGERRTDFLVIGEDESVTCISCGTTYYVPVADDDTLPLVDWFALAHPGACM